MHFIFTCNYQVSFSEAKFVTYIDGNAISIVVSLEVWGGAGNIIT